MLAAVFDTALPEPIRNRASRVLDGFDDTTTGEQRRNWWASADPVVRRHALRFMTRAEADLLVPVASDDTHPMQATAVLSMSFGFEEAEFVPVLVGALAHLDPEVRRAAVEACFWSEPIAAEPGLLAAACDETVELAEAALDTLRYYPTQRVLRGVAELRTGEDERIREAATITFDDLRDTFESAVTIGDAKDVALLREWMRPVYDLVAWPDQMSVREPGVPRGSRRPAVMPEPELVALLDDPDADREELERALRACDWTGYDPGARSRTAARLMAHPNPLVREIGCSALADWDRAHNLMTLAEDRSANVRKMAIYCLSLLPADPAVGELAWRLLPTVTGTAAQEMVQTYVAHVGDVAVDRLVELVRSDPREAVRYESIHALTKLNAVKEIHALSDLLAQPPGVHWGIHTALIACLSTLDIRVPIPSHLAAVDELHLQSALAEYTARWS
ncbi:hypothetical protein GPX89_30065 [Nocardia sp. ET3-3]|uniref:HEAT repeat domain-containing protein n=1 Tax=Nocardia terrae TaxID=2675851 RepID=A0A7K1V4C3_9NOCA|nr:hypothetical protein [Nocardia terrae]MVU81474.1 hypothetical protein [Nocardia terrae]